MMLNGMPDSIESQALCHRKVIKQYQHHTIQIHTPPHVSCITSLLNSMLATNLSFAVYFNKEINVDNVRDVSNMTGRY